MEHQDINEELIERVEKAAAKGARSGGGGKIFLYLIILLIAIPLVVIGGLIFLKLSMEKKWNNFAQEFAAQLTFSDPAEVHDKVLENDGILGYTAADFAEAVLGDGTQLKRVEVYEVKLSDVVTLTDTGLANLAIFTKTQLITYNGIATYTVDLSKLTKDDFSLDDREKVVTIHIPHTVCGTINIPSDEMEFGDTEHGWLAFGDISMTASQMSEIETEARVRMEEKLVELNETETADRFAVMTIWEMYQPIISSVSPEYRLDIEFTD